MIYDQDTMPIPRIRDPRPTFRQFRERHRVSYFELAQQSKVRVCRVYWMEQGYTTEFALAVRILSALSQRVGEPIRFEQLQGLHLKNSLLTCMAACLHSQQKGKH